MGTLLSSWSAITRPKTTIVSGSTIRIRPRPNNSGFSAIAPTVAPPTTFSAHAVAIPVPAIVIAADSAANGSATMRLYLLCRSRTKGTERSPVALVELDEGLHVVQPEGLNPRRNPTEQEDEQLRHDQEDDAEDHEADLAGKDHSLKEDRVERGRNRRLADSKPGKSRVRHDVREESRDFDGGDHRFGQA